MAEVLAANPFPKCAPNRTIAIFLDEPPHADALADIRGRKDEELRLSTREIYVHYKEGIGKSSSSFQPLKQNSAKHEYGGQTCRAHV